MYSRPHATLVIMRHGESYTNLKRVYSGWYDTDITPKGIQESKDSALLLKKIGIKFDICYSSVLKRAIRTLWITLDILDLMHIPIIKSWRLNECHFGSFTGLNREEILNSFGEETIEKWKTSFSFTPPPITIESPFHPSKDIKYSHLDPSILPVGESIQMLHNRVEPFWIDEISQSLKNGKNVLLVGHGNVMRSFIKRFEKLSDDEIMKRFVVPNGFPILFEFDKELNVINSKMIDDNEITKRSIFMSDGIL